MTQNNKYELLAKIWSEFSENKIAVVALVCFSIILFVAVFASVISPTDPYDLATVTIMNSRLAPIGRGFVRKYILVGNRWCG